MMTAYRFYELKRNPNLIPLLTDEERNEFNSELKHEHRSNAAKRAVQTKRKKYSTWPTRRNDHMPNSNYVLQVDEKSFCPKCNKNVELLVHKYANKGAPMFYICFDCRLVTQIGKGEVPRE